VQVSSSPVGVPAHRGIARRAEREAVPAEVRDVDAVPDPGGRSAVHRLVGSEPLPRPRVGVGGVDVDRVDLATVVVSVHDRPLDPGIACVVAVAPVEVARHVSGRGVRVGVHRPGWSGVSRSCWCQTESDSGSECEADACELLPVHDIPLLLTPCSVERESSHYERKGYPLKAGHLYTTTVSGF
jgi:hypothetical protein